MQKITQVQQTIIKLLIFPESFHTIQDETKMPQGEIRDDIMQLLHLGLIKAVNKNQNNNEKIFFYDLDQIGECLFQATPKGLKVIKLAIAKSAS